MRIVRWAALALVVILWGLPAEAQFGQNKITYDRFDWQVYHSPHFDIHYYGAEEPFLDDLISYAESAYVRISTALDHELKFRVPLIVYKTHAEFEQTNVSLSEVPPGVGAFAEPVQNRIVLPMDQPPDRLFALMSHELVHIFEYSILFEGSLGRTLRSRPPLWFMEGLASYLGRDEDNLDRMAIRDAVVNNILPPVQALNRFSYLTYRYGHAIFDFIEQEKGKEGVRNLVFEYRKVLLTNNMEKAFKDALGWDLDTFNRRFNTYLRKKYLPVLMDKKAPEDYGKEIGFHKQHVFTFAPAVSPSGELVAVLAAPKVDLDLLVLPTDGGKPVRNLTRGWTNRYRWLVAEAFQGKRDLSWSPAGDDVAVFARVENTRRLLIFDALRGKLRRQVRLGKIADAASPAFSPDGGRIAFEGNLNGVVDIFEMDLKSGEIRNLTQDDFFDANPWYSPDGKTLVYNRRIGPYWKVFSVDTSDPSRKTQLTFGPSGDLQPSYSRDAKTVYFSSDRSDYHVFDLYALDLETGNVRQLTDVVGGCFAPVELAERDGEPYLAFVAFHRGTFRLFRMPVGEEHAEKKKAAQAETAEAEVQPFEPPLHLTADPSKKAPYKVHWDLEAPLVSVGVADDGTVLTDVALQFSDLLGDRRITLQGYSVASYSNMRVNYLNMKRRFNWGATAYDYRDYFLSEGAAGGLRQDQVQRTTGAAVFAQYPFNRYYRVEGSLGFLDRSQDFIVGTDQFGFPVFQRFSDRFALSGLSFIGDTTRFRSFGPFQGKRFNVSVTYGANLGGDRDGNLLTYQLDYRAYRQLTARSLIAWRLASYYSDGGLETFYPLGGMNQLRGYNFRDFFGSRVAWSNLELRFPLVDELRFPFGALRDLRGFLFTDVGAAWFQDDSWYDPEYFLIRTDPKFRLWDSDHSRFQDGRGAYGFGFQFFFLGGLQLNWVWAKRFPYTQFVPELDQGGQVVFIPQKADTGGYRTDFYITYDF